MEYSFSMRISNSDEEVDAMHDQLVQDGRWSSHHASSIFCQLLMTYINEGFYLFRVHPVSTDHIE